MRADRLVALLLLLQSRGRLSAAQLAAELGVSVRTVYRDTVALSTAGIPIYADPSGYQLVAGYQTQLTGLTADEARGLPLAGLPGAAAALGLAEAVAAAQLKLTAALPQTLRERATRMRERFHLDTPGWYQDADNCPYLAEVADAVWQQHLLDVEYENWKDVAQHRLQPYGLVLKAGKWYLVAHARRGVRTFRVSQIRALTVLSERFDWPAGFDLAAYWQEHIQDFRARLHRGEALVRLDPAAVDNLRHFLGQAVADAAAAGEPQPDGWLLARLPIESETHATREFLRLGPVIEVLEPLTLRDRIAATVAELARLYG